MPRAAIIALCLGLFALPAAAADSGSAWISQIDTARSFVPTGVGQASALDESDGQATAERDLMNYVSVADTGEDDKALIRQYGGMDIARVTQTGAANTAVIVQFGAGSVATVTQAGYGNFASIRQ
jgi:hypothetical protein